MLLVLVDPPRGPLFFQFEALGNSKNRKCGKIAEKIGFNKNKAACAFPGQPIDLLIYHSNLADRRMADAVLELDLDNMKIRERIKAAIKIMQPDFII